MAGSSDRYLTQDTAGVTALDRPTGEIRWPVETYDRSSTTVTGIPAILDGGVYISG